MCQISQISLLDIAFKTSELLNHQSDFVKGRALLIMAYSLYNLPVDGLKIFVDTTKKDLLAIANQ